MIWVSEVDSTLSFGGGVGRADWGEAMRTLLLHVERSADWDPDYWVKSHDGGLVVLDRYAVELNDSWMSITPANEAIEDYEDADLKHVEEFIGVQDIYLIEWRGESALQIFFDEFPREVKAVIDNDQGLITPISRIFGLPISAWINSYGE